VKFFLSGETDVQIGEAHRLISNEIEAKIKTLADNDYGSEFTYIGVIPIIIDPKRGLFEEGFFKERILIKRKAKETDIRLKTDFNKFFAADYETKRLLLLENIIRSIKAIGVKSKGDFQSEKLVKDILQLFGVSHETLDNL
jgi:hypothetical protein